MIALLPNGLVYRRLRGGPDVIWVCFAFLLEIVCCFCFCLECIGIIAIRKSYIEVAHRVILVLHVAPEDKARRLRDLKVLHRCLLLPALPEARDI